MKYENNSENYNNELYKGLFGETDRVNGEYHFKSGERQHLYSNARYTPLDDDTIPPKYFRPEEKKPASHERKHKRNSGLIFVMVLCLSCAIIGGILGAGIMSTYFKAKDSMEVNTEASTEVSRNLNSVYSGDTISSASYSDESIALSSSEIYNHAQNEVVMITTEYQYRNQNGMVMPGNVTGSGFVYTDDGYIITNYHVVEKAQQGGYSVTVTFNNGDVYDGSVVGYDNDEDIAVVKINGENLQCVGVDLTDDTVKGGENITIAGNPYGMFNVSSGHISNPNANIANDDGSGYYDVIQLDVTIYEGNSGGPVYNSHGKVIGMVTAKLSVNNADGIGFAIPMSKIGPIVSDLIENGYVTGLADLGCDFYTEYNQMFKAYYSLPEGAFIEGVTPGSCSYYAGIEAGDVIAQVGDYEIRDYRDIDSVLKIFRPGDTVRVYLYREGNLMMATVTLDEKS